MRQLTRSLVGAASGEPGERGADVVVALIGNPNTGKTALFNALTGFRRHVANYAGVTVDIGHGPVRGVRRVIGLLDLPGTYSLSAASPDEQIVCDLLGGHASGHRRPDAILVVVDAANLARNLYLVSQLLEVGLPVVVALNMVDIAAARGIRVDAERLSERLGVPVVPVVAVRAETIRPLTAALEAIPAQRPPAVRAALRPALVQAVAEVQAAAGGGLGFCEALRALVDEGACAEARFVERGGSCDILAGLRRRLADIGLGPGPAEVRARYAWVNQVLDGVIERRAPAGGGWTERIDRVLTHRAAGALVLVAILYALFYSLYAVADPITGAVDRGLGWLGEWLGGVMPAGVLRSLLSDGVIGGVGGVLAFVPQILILFLFIGILEDCGYLSRAAFMVDRLMRVVGLSGRAFIPLLSSFACAVPAIMGTRAIANRRERLITILIAPFMSCSARLPIYVLLIGAFVPPRSWLGGWVRLDALVMLGMYLTGALVSIPIAYVLSRTVFAGPAPAFLLELPSYKWPRLRTVWQRVYLAGRDFLMRAGSIILLVGLLVWTLGYFPRSASAAAALRAQARNEGWSEERLDTQLAGVQLRDSYLGRLGHAIEPALAPLGWDWRIGVGVIAAFPARELVVATLGTVANLESGGERAVPLRQAVAEMKREDTGQPLIDLPIALSIMVFFALCAQCVGTLTVMARETGSWRWPAISFVGMTTLAYLAAWGVSAGGRAVGL